MNFLSVFQWQIDHKLNISLHVSAIIFESNKVSRMYHMMHNYIPIINKHIDLTKIMKKPNSDNLHHL